MICPASTGNPGSCASAVVQRIREVGELLIVVGERRAVFVREVVVEAERRVTPHRFDRHVEREALQVGVDGFERSAVTAPANVGEHACRCRIDRASLAVCAPPAPAR